MFPKKQLKLRKTIYKKNPIEMTNEELDNYIMKLNEKLLELKRSISRTNIIPEIYNQLQEEIKILHNEKMRRNKEAFIQKILNLQNHEEDEEEMGEIVLETDPVLSEAESRINLSDVEEIWDEEEE